MTRQTGQRERTLTEYRAAMAADPSASFYVPGHFGRDWAGRLMACVNGPEHRGRRCLGSHGGTLRRAK